MSEALDTPKASNAEPMKQPLKRWHVPPGQAIRVMGALRSVKMVQPRCTQGCQGAYGWWEYCPHDPYFHSTMTDIQEPVLEEQINEKTGDIETIVTRMEVKRIYDQSPNVSQVAVDANVNSGTGANKMLRRGWKFPEDLGYAPACEMRGCWLQDAPDDKDRKGLPVRIRDGNYCCEEHAKLVKVTKGNAHEPTLLHTDPARRKSQLEATPLV